MGFKWDLMEFKWDLNGNIWVLRWNSMVVGVFFYDGDTMIRWFRKYVTAERHSSLVIFSCNSQIFLEDPVTIIIVVVIPIIMVIYMVI